MRLRRCQLMGGMRVMKKTARAVFCRLRQLVPTRDFLIRNVHPTFVTEHSEYHLAFGSVQPSLGLPLRKLFIALTTSAAARINTSSFLLNADGASPSLMYQEKWLHIAVLIASISPRARVTPPSSPSTPELSPRERHSHHRIQKSECQYCRQHSQPETHYP